MRFLLLAAVLAATPALARANPQIDYPAFEALTASVAPQRANRLLAFDAFKAEAARSDVLLLDARSKDAFQRGHIAGAVNLPLTDFTADSLAAVIGADPDRPILIYCNNNFSNHVSPVPLKSAPLALNIQTFINLVGYGYPNVYELADVVDFNDPKVGWTRSDTGG
ncbi:MAG: hypothetical protein CVT78_02800 [Alphaproteobacteria bacterium HGW-Alphaproteobacteria-17]|nr:MAG: hypothetical protein CVT78_02800 [Alphaproteobacteria bacterium HGW-Alphaproteobacteria-17]